MGINDQAETLGSIGKIFTFVIIGILVYVAFFGYLPSWVLGIDLKLILIITGIVIVIFLILRKPRRSIKKCTRCGRAVKNKQYMYCNKCWKRNKGRKSKVKEQKRRSRQKRKR